jgi:type IX secretion system PorP/SprF family membrane protein
LIFLSDKTGVTTVNEAIGVYSYRIKISDDKVLSFGLQAGLTNITIDNTQLLIQDPDDPLFAGKTNESKPTFGAGVLVTADRFLIGISVPRMLKVINTAEGLDNDLYTQHFYALASYLFFVNENVRFKPSVLTRIVTGAPVSLDLNAAFTFNERYTAGLLTRNFKTCGVLLQGLFNSFRLGYVIEVPTGTTTVGFNQLTHEITLGIKANVFSFHKSTLNSF